MPDLVLEPELETELELDMKSELEAGMNLKRELALNPGKKLASNTRTIEPTRSAKPCSTRVAHGI